MTKLPGGDKLPPFYPVTGRGVMNAPAVQNIKISSDSLGPLHRHPFLEEKLKKQELSNEKGLPPKHVIVDEDDWEEGRDAIKIVRGIIAQKETLPTLLGLNSILDRKIHKALEE